MTVFGDYKTNFKNFRSLHASLNKVGVYEHVLNIETTECSWTKTRFSRENTLASLRPLLKSITF